MSNVTPDISCPARQVQEFSENIEVREGFMTGASRSAFATRFTSNATPCLMILFPTMFFAYQFVVRIIPSLLADQIMQQLQVGASLFGMLSVSYYLGYALANIPMAILMEKYSPRLVISSSSILCGIFLFAFHNVTNPHLALVIRFFIGAVSCVGFISISKVALQWFSKDSYGMALSISVTIGLGGAVFAGGPLDSLITLYGSNNVIMAIVLLSFVVGASIFFFLRSPSDQVTAGSVAVIKLPDLKKALLSPEVFLLGLGSMLMMGFDNGFSDLWGVSYLVANFSIAKNEAASAISWVFTGVLVGALVVPFLGRKLGEARIIVGTAVLTAVIFYFVILATSNLSSTFLSLTMFFLGVLSAAKILTFAMCARIVDAKIASVALSLLNCIFMSGGIFHHSLIGTLLDHFWTGELVDGQRYYSADAFYWSLLVIPVGAMIGSALVIFVNRMAKRKGLLSSSGSDEG